LLELNKIYCMDNVEGMKLLDNNSIDLTVTSPPYDNLRSYKGFQWNFENVAKQLFIVTSVGGVIVWVVGDSTVKGSETGTSFKQALYFKEIGFNLHDTMIYAKNNPMPLTHNRYEQQFEYMFILSKGKPKLFNPILQDCKTKGKEYSWEDTNDYGQNSAKRARKEISKVKEKKYKYNIWFYNVANSKFTNSAPFPEKLAEDHILSWSNEGDLVFDPFMGSGTTCKMAKLNGRNYIGFEISQEYCDIANQRI
jgi:DNA modification methylase